LFLPVGDTIAIERILLKETLTAGGTFVDIGAKWTQPSAWNGALGITNLPPEPQWIKLGLPANSYQLKMKKTLWSGLNRSGGTFQIIVRGQCASYL
jgi:hypothetical protein